MPAAPDTLSRREREVYEMLMLGKNRSRIAEELGIGAETVKTLTNRIKEKFKANGGEIKTSARGKGFSRYYDSSLKGSQGGGKEKLKKELSQKFHRFGYKKLLKYEEPDAEEKLALAVNEMGYQSYLYKKRSELTNLVNDSAHYPTVTINAVPQDEKEEALEEALEFFGATMIKREVDEEDEGRGARTYAIKNQAIASMLGLLK